MQTTVEAWPLRPEQDLLPASPLRFRVRATNVAGDSEWSGVMQASTDLAGFCGNAADVLTFRDSHSTLQADIQSCLIRCIFDPDQVACATACVVEDVGLSSQCSGCWSNMGLCTLQRCALPCIIPTSAACEECSERECFPDTVACTGIPMWAFPR